MIDNVILVDPQDEQIGLMEKMDAHLTGSLHRAFSIFIFNRDGKLLLQQRAFGKYHSGGKWTNTCCSHPKENEITELAAHRRLIEEMGMSCELTYGFSFLYKAEVDEGILEHEYDHVYFGISDNKPILTPEEVVDFKYLSLDELKADIQLNPQEYTEWLKICLDRVLDFYKKWFKNGNIA